MGSSSAEAKSSEEEEERGRSRNGRRRRVSGVAVEVPPEEDVEPFPTFDPIVPGHVQLSRSGSNVSAVAVVPSASTPTPTPIPSPVVLKSESFFARRKKRFEKGKDVSERLAEVRESPAAQKPKVMKDLLEFAGWRSGDKKDGSK